jgi:hypothetical protein
VKSYEQEVRDRWGDTDAYKQSINKTAKYSKSDFAAAKAEQGAAVKIFLEAFREKLEPQSEKAQSAVLAHRDAITKWFYDCSIEMQMNLAVMYLQDSRFKKHYDDHASGLAQYIHDAIMAQPNS